MPSQWVESMLNIQHPADALEAIRKIAGTSHIATFYKIGSKISTEYIGVLTNSHEMVVSSISNNPRLKKPENDKSIEEQAVFKNASEIRSITYPQNKFFWLKYSKDVAVPADNDSRSWREVLYPIIEELKLNKKLGPSISGCISYLNKPGVMREEFFLKARQRIASDNDFFEVSKHPDFELFLVKKIDELIGNREQKK